MKFKLLLLFAFAAWYGHAQQFAPKERYLVDSLDLSKIDSMERVFLDSSLHVFHNTKSDTTRLRIVDRIIHEKSDPAVWHAYNRWRHAYVKQLLEADKNLSSEEKKVLRRDFADAEAVLGDYLEHEGQAGKSIPHYEKAIELNREMGNYKGVGYACNQIGLAYVDLGKTTEARDMYLKALEAYKQADEKKSISSTYNNLGSLYAEWGDIPQAADYFMKSIKIKEEIGDLSGQSVTLNNLGAVFYGQGNMEKALECMQRSMDIDRKLGSEEDVAMGLNNIGSIHHNLEEYREAIRCFREAQQIYEKHENLFGIGMCLNNLSGNLAKIDSMQEGMRCLREAQHIFESIDSRTWLAYTYNKLAGLHRQQGHLDSALYFGEKGLVVAQELGHMENIKRSSETLYLAYEKLGNTGKALEMYKQFVTLRDSISDIHSQRAAIELQTKYEYEKQKALDDKENEKLLAIEKAKQERQYIILLFTIGGAAIISVLLLIIYRRLKLTRKQKRIIEEQKEEVEAQRDQIEEQKAVVEVQRDDIVASINYAKRIQEALLRNHEYEAGNLPPHFILFQPKDIVSGDFYWTLEKQGCYYFAAVDCTGHGVPGAFLTMLGSSFLNEITAASELLQPADILSKLRAKIVKELSADQETKDGMDISLALLDTKTKQLQWAGANNPLYLLRNGADEMEVIRGDRQPIGYAEHAKPFTNHRVSLQSGDQMYLFTDGYADQFGGKNSKKMGYKTFRDKLVECRSMNMTEQRDHLKTFFAAHKGNEEQVDDVCIMSIKLI